MKFTLLATNCLVMAAVSSSTEMQMAAALSLLILLQKRSSKAAMKKERLGTGSSAPSLRVMKNAELTPVATTYAPSLKSMKYSASRRVRSTLCCGSTSCSKFARDSLVYLFTTQRPRSGDRPTPKEPMCSANTSCRTRRLILFVMSLLRRKASSSTSTKRT